jgi:hypothetical protein
MQVNQNRGPLGAVWKVVLVAAVLALNFASRASAANLLTNGSFESGTYTFGGDGAVALAVGSPAITGWTVVTNTIAPIEATNSYAIVPEDGNVMLDLQGYSDSSPYGGVSQDVATSPGTEYDLSFWVGVQNSISYAVGPASVTASAGATSQTFTNNLSGAGNQWEQFNLDFTASAATTTITLSGTSTGGGAYIGLDNAVLQAATGPGPSTVPLPPAFWTALPVLAALAIAGKAKTAISKRSTKIC